MGRSRRWGDLDINVYGEKVQMHAQGHSLFLTKEQQPLCPRPPYCRVVSDTSDPNRMSAASSAPCIGEECKDEGATITELAVSEERSDGGPGSYIIYSAPFVFFGASLIGPKFSTSRHIE